MKIKIGYSQSFVRQTMIKKGLSLLILITIIFLSSCSGKKASDSRDCTETDTCVTDSVVSVTPSELMLTSEGIGEITIGMLTSQIPLELPGVYDSVHSEDGYESNTYLFMEDGKPLFTAYEFTEGTLDVVSAESPRVFVMAPDGTKLRIGEEFSKVLALPGVEAEWENADGEGMWCWNWKGIWFQLDQAHLPEELSRELYSSIAPPSSTSFTSDARIGYMGTGLPW